MSGYLNLAKTGKNEWWRYVLAILTMLFAWQLIGAVPTVLLILWVMLDGDPTTSVTATGSFPGVDTNLSFTVMMLASWAFMGGIVLAMRVIHQRKTLTLVTSENAVNWRRLFQGFAAWFFLAAAVGILEALLYPGRYVFTPDLIRLIPFIFLAFIFIPIQTSTEELFFRGYILQSFGLRLRSHILLSLISGFIFMLPHLLNPEARLNYLLMSLYYFSLGAAMAYITLKDGRLELALGMHAANNLFTGLFANATVTVMPTPALFTVVELDTVYSTIASLVAIVIFLIIFQGPLRRKDQTTSPEQSFGA